MDTLRVSIKNFASVQKLSKVISLPMLDRREDRRVHIRPIAAGGLDQGHRWAAQPAVRRARCRFARGGGEGCDDRDERLKLSCCICLQDGWDYKDCYAPLRNMVIPNCRHNSHAICIQCIQKIAYEEVEKHTAQNEGFLKFQCPYPYSNHSCRGKIKKRVWESLLPLDSLQKNTMFLTNQHEQLCTSKHKKYVIKCTQCLGETIVFNNPEEQRWICSQCSRKSCGRCDEPSCFNMECKTILQQNLRKGYSRYFTEKLLNGSTIPLRKHRVSNAMKQQKIESFKNTFPLVHANCPTCKIPLYKTSACNDLKHCGSMNVCNFCCMQSFPWEHGMPLEHWKSCIRWDSDIDWLPCKENECFDELHECTLAAHVPFIEKISALKARAFLSGVEKEFKNN